MSSNKTKGGAEKCRLKRQAEFKIVGNDKKQMKLSFFIDKTVVDSKVSTIYCYFS